MFSLDLCSFDGYFLWMFFRSVKEVSKACKTTELSDGEITVAHTNFMETLKFLKRKILDG